MVRNQLQSSSGMDSFIRSDSPEKLTYVLISFIAEKQKNKVYCLYMNELPALFSPVYLIFYAILLLIIYHLFIKQTASRVSQEEKHIVVVGGGFAGIGAIIRLRRRLYDSPHKITLIDHNTYHLFTPSLYEVATSEEPKKNVAIPFTKIFRQGLAFVHQSVKTIDPTTKKITLADKSAITYDYLVLAAGSQSAYMGIPGLEKYSTGFKTLQDALT